MSVFALSFGGMSQQPQRIFAALAFVSRTSAQVFFVAALEFGPFQKYWQSPSLAT